MYLNRLPVILAVTACVAIAPAQAASASWDETAALATFLDANPRIVAIRQQVGVARAEAVAAGVLPNPTIDLTREQVFLAGGPAEENRAAIQMPIPVSGRRELRQAIAQFGIQAAEARAEQQIQGLVYDFRSAFTQAYRHEAGSRVLSEGLATFRRLERIAEVRNKAGESAGYDVLRLRLGRSALEARLVEANARAGEERGRLAGLLGRPLEGTLSLADLGPIPDETRLVSMALARRADIQVLRADQAQASLALSLAERARWPDPEVAIGVKQTNEPTVQGLGYTAGLKWPLPLFDRGQGAEARAKAELERLKAEEAALEARLRVEIPSARAAALARLSALERLEREVLAQVPAVIRVAETAYREGEQGLTPLLDAYQTGLDARLQYLDLALAARLARLDLERLVGGDYSDAPRSNP